MSDEELIEKAAKAILDAEGIEPAEDGTYWGAGTWPNAVKDARACLAVFREHTVSGSADTEIEPTGEFTATNGLKVSVDVRGAVGVQWGSPRSGGWTYHDPDETQALREFFRRGAPAESVKGRGDV